MQPWKTLARRMVLDRGKYLKVEEHTVQLPNGRIIPDWPWIITPDYVNALVQDERGGFLCFRQVKYAIEGTSLAVLGGYMEPGEEPLAAVQRELREEMGCVASEWIPLGSYRVDGNRGAGTGHLFFARRARRVAEPNADDLEELELLFMSEEELRVALRAGQFKILAWAMTVALGLLYLDERFTAHTSRTSDSPPV